MVLRGSRQARDGGDSAATRSESERASGFQRFPGLQRLQPQAMGDGGTVATPWRSGQRGYGGHLSPDRSGPPDVGGRRARGVAAGHRFTGQAAGRGTAPLRRERRRSGNRAHGPGANRLASRRSPVVSYSGEAALLLASLSVAVRRRPPTGSSNVPAILPP